MSEERRGERLGRTVQAIPHVTDEIHVRLKRGAVGAGVAIVEIGGTVVGIDSLPVLEETRQLGIQEGDPGGGSRRGIEKGHRNTSFIHLALVPWCGSVRLAGSRPDSPGVR